MTVTVVLLATIWLSESIVTTIPFCDQIDQRNTPLCSCIGRVAVDLAVQTFNYTYSGNSVFLYETVSDETIVDTGQAQSVLYTALFCNGVPVTSQTIPLAQVTTLPAGPGEISFGYNDNGAFFPFFGTFGQCSGEYFFQIEFVDQNGVTMTCLRTQVCGAVAPCNINV